MAEDLQGLLNKIQSEGVNKAEEEKARIIASAKEEAAKIVADAKAKAEETVKKAESDAKSSEERAKAAIRQAARDVIIALKSDLDARIKAVAKDCLGKAVDADTLAKTVLEIAKSGSQDKGIQAIVSEKDAAALESSVKGGLLANLKVKPLISIGKGFGSGLKVGFVGEDVMFDLTDDALAGLIGEFVGPKLAAIIDPAKKA